MPRRCIFLNLSISSINHSHSASRLLVNAFSHNTGMKQANPTTVPINAKFSTKPRLSLPPSILPPSILLFRLKSCCSCVHKWPSRSKCLTSFQPTPLPCPYPMPPSRPPLPPPLVAPLPNPAALDALAVCPSAAAALFAPCAPHPPLR